MRAVQYAEVAVIDLVRKRHDGDGWIVFTELADKTGFANRHADALALGVWASTKYEAHLYEFKVSREDVKRELRDPTKVEGVGKYAHYWWLAINDEKIIADLVIPDAWGIVLRKPHGTTFQAKVLRKAPRLKPKEIGVLFAVGMIRNIAKTWVTTAKHSAVVEELYQLKTGKPATAEEMDSERTVYALERKLENLQRAVKNFEEKSGVDMAVVLEGGWRAGELGRAVKIALEVEGPKGHDKLRMDIARLVATASEYRGVAEHAARTAGQLRALLDPGGDHSPQCNRRMSFGHGGCSCGVDLSDDEKLLLPTIEEPPCDTPS